ncbi:hypothetical protein B0H13DRAFT_1869539 [Mycena leptocephala]|nr:hypothetical protein B0H13DRAFT_1869539 [Mycena leptocephala]
MLFHTKFPGRLLGNHEEHHIHVCEFPDSFIRITRLTHWYTLVCKDWRCRKLLFKEQEKQACLLSIQMKREQWKAVSARYYEMHPEVRERKHVIMAEKRAAKRLARRHCDPPKQAKSTPDIGLSPASAEVSAAESLLFLQQSTKSNPFPPDLLCSDDPGTSMD